MPEQGEFGRVTFRLIIHALTLA